MSSRQQSHPLPPPPTGQQQQQFQQYQLPEKRPEQQHRSNTSFSLRSDRSHKSSGSAGKVDPNETSQENGSQRLSLSTKAADPRLAMQEAEPSAVATGQATSLSPIRAIQHMDTNGNLIADPDRSNPTRSRWERPLDTIRSFEAAIDGNYSRKSYIRNESADVGTNLNRRSTYTGGGPHGNPMHSYNAGRPNSFRPDSYVENRGANSGMSRPDSYLENNSRPSNGYYPSRARYPRTASEPQFNSGAGIYPGHGMQQSYETVTTASGSGSSGDPLGYSTDPSSDNSSLDRVQPPPPPEHNYSTGLNGSNGYGGAQPNYMPNYSSNGYASYGTKQSEMPMMSGGYQGQFGGPPAPPHKDQGPPRVPIKLGSAPNGGPTTYEAPRPGAAEKRKSWFGRRFSRA